jgi:DNA-binding MurR/RpiR family transcriptional regulator
MDCASTNTAPFSERLRTAADRLTDADKRLVATILDGPHATALLSSKEIAARAGVHEATATRLAQKLGYRGYPDLRDALQQTYLLRSDPAQRVARSIERVATGGFLADLVESECAALTALVDAIPQQALDDAARQLAAARRIHVFARGHANALADVLVRRLQRSGCDTVRLQGDDRDLAERLAGLTDSDALVAFGFRTKPAGFDVVLGQASAVGAARLVIADFAIAALLTPGTPVLAAARGRSRDEYQTLTVPMAIVNALVLTLAKHQSQQTVATLDKIAAILDQLGR